MGDYNGWSNYETWNVALWLDNEEWMYREIQRMLEQTAKRKGSAYTLAVKIKRFVSEEFRANEHTFGGLDKWDEIRRVHFKEIARNLLDDYLLDQKSK